MPWGLTRFHHNGQSHFVTFCCYHRHRLFTADASCRIFESALERVRRSYRLYVYGYVVMPEHVHLLLSEPQRQGGPLKPGFGLSGDVHWLSKTQQHTLADALKSLKQGVSRRLIPKMGGPLKPAFGLSGAVRRLDKVFPPLVRVFGPSIPTRSLRVLQRRQRSGESCSTASPPDDRITLASPDCGE